jgi:hypothetical protein
MISYSFAVAKMSPCGLMIIIVFRFILLILVIVSFGLFAIFVENTSECLSEEGLDF